MILLGSIHVSYIVSSSRQLITFNLTTAEQDRFFKLQP